MLNKVKRWKMIVSTFLKVMPAIGKVAGNLWMLLYSYMTIAHLFLEDKYVSADFEPDFDRPRESFLVFFQA